MRKRGVFENFRRPPTDFSGGGCHLNDERSPTPSYTTRVKNLHKWLETHYPGIQFNKKGVQLASSIKKEDIEKLDYMRYTLLVELENPKVIATDYLYCNGSGNCLRKCGGTGQCMPGMLILNYVPIRCEFSASLYSQHSLN